MNIQIDGIYTEIHPRDARDMESFAHRYYHAWTALSKHILYVNNAPNAHSTNNIVYCLVIGVGEEFNCKHSIDKVM